MNNRKGGFGAKLLLVLILMLASAIGGAYAYRVLDGKMAVRDAKKEVESIKISEYDTSEASQVQSYIDDVNANLETATTRKEVYEIMDSFSDEVDKVMTKTEKELEEALKEAEEAKKNQVNDNDDDIEDDIDSNETNDDNDNSSNSIFDIFN